ARSRPSCDNAPTATKEYRTHHVRRKGHKKAPRFRKSRGYGQTTSGGLLTWRILRRPPADTPTVPRDGASTPPNASQCTSPPADAAPTAAPNSNPAGTATTSLPGPEEGPPTPSTDRRSARPATCGKGISLP